MTPTILRKVIGLPSLTLVRQSENAECGLACMAMVAAYYGNNTSLSILRRQHGVSSHGITFGGLIGLAQSMDMEGRALRVQIEALQEVRRPAVLHWNLNHFVVLSEATKNGATIFDPARGIRRLNWDEVSSCFTGIVVEFAPSSSFEKKEEIVKPRLRDLWGDLSAYWKPLGIVLVFTVLLQIFALASPLYMQLAVDEAVLSGDVDLLSVIALGFGFLALFSIFTSFLRQRLGIFIGNSLSYQMNNSIMSHLLRLPFFYFEKRDVGDVLSRLGSVAPIQRLFTDNALAALIDGAFSVTTLALMYIYSPLLASIVLVTSGVYLVIRIAFLQPLHDRMLDTIQAGAELNTNLIETIRGMSTIRAQGQETQRQRIWQDKFADTMQTGVRQSLLNINFGTVQGILFQLSHILVVYFAVSTVITNDMSLGMAYAFLAYSGTFSGSVQGLIKQVIDFRLLSLHLERLSDIIFTERDSAFTEQPCAEKNMEGRLELRNLTFKYGHDEPLLFQNLNLTVEAGTSVAITGRSGAGKTTLLKIASGLLEATEGELWIDQMKIQNFGYKNFRRHVSIILQDDQLLGGTIAENIASFDDEIDTNWMQNCAKLAAIHEEIIAMPMAYETMVGDMGNSLSGGQLQRILLARALYRRPKFLLIDEGTSHLDHENEKRVSAALSGLGITRFMIAHRKETLSLADRVLVMHEGKLVEQPKPDR